jgi:hypothetical protein
MARFKLPEGSLFLVPTSKGDAVGVISRVGRGNVMIAYFFPPDALGDTPDGSGLNPADAIAIVRLGPLGFKLQGWPVLGTIPKWNREAWGAVTFKSKPAGISHYIAQVYDDMNINKRIAHRTVSDEEAATLPEDGAYGDQLIPGLLERSLP